MDVSRAIEITEKHAHALAASHPLMGLFGEALLVLRDTVTAQGERIRELEGKDTLRTQDHPLVRENRALSSDELTAIEERNEYRKRVRSQIPPGDWQWGENEDRVIPDVITAPFLFRSQFAANLASHQPFDGSEAVILDYAGCGSHSLYAAPATRDFILHAHNDNVEQDIESLLAEVRQLRATLEQLQEILEQRKQSS